MVNFGKQLKKLVKSRGFNFSSLANQMGVNNVYLSQIVTGRRRPGRDTLLKLSSALEVPIDALLTLGGVRAKLTAAPRKIPVLNDSALLAWITNEDLEHPILYADTFEYASTIDSHAFYLHSSDAKVPALGAYDLILITPTSAISTGDTVLKCSHGIFSLGKIVIAHGLTILFNGQPEQLLFAEEINIEGLTLFRAIQGIKNI